MRKIRCSKCNGIYFEDDSINNMISLQLKVFQSNSCHTKDEYERMNPTLRANTKTVLYESKTYLQKHLGSDDFCECMFNKIEEESKQRMIDNSFKEFKKTRELSNSEIEQIKQKGKSMVLINAIENIFKKYNY
ncbi:MAG: hypothetical protein HN921_06825 [Bacteroidetes bacterium]|jgi:hypothetical protein|nr:hypothetical protein [Bacteroidota bacterium]